jgi:hypothetical protein
VNCRALFFCSDSEMSRHHKRLNPLTLIVVAEDLQGLERMPKMLEENLLVAARVPLVCF